MFIKMEELKKIGLFDENIFYIMKRPIFILDAIKQTLGYI